MFGKHPLCPHVEEALREACEQGNTKRMFEILEEHHKHMAKVLSDLNFMRTLLESYSDNLIERSFLFMLEKTLNNPDNEKLRNHVMETFMNQYIPKQKQELEKINEYFRKMFDDTEKLKQEDF